ncbi:MAG: hypothetical protein IJ387_02925, partial [Thermoguttaceae bacterium]|nr:hypothetical protein [Thermoguttaceae bacterium]
MTDWTVKRRVAVGRVSLAAASSAAFGVSTAKAAVESENGKANAAAVAGDANAEEAEETKQAETSSAEAAAVELFGDLNFERGFEIVDGPETLGVLRLPFDGENGENGETEKPGRLGEIGETGETGAAPTWKLAQHHSKFDLSRPETQTATATEARAAT